MRNCASGNLEIPGMVLTHHPGMTGDGSSSFRTERGTRADPEVRGKARDSGFARSDARPEMTSVNRHSLISRGLRV
jgi:hypothetical protein